MLPYQHCIISLTFPYRTTSSRVSKTSRSNSVERSEVSLGAKIVQKSRENNAKSAPIKRTDGGRYSMRVTGTKATSSTSSNSTAPGGRPTSGKKPASRSNSALLREQRERESEKEKEKAAWERRRSYDPRRAVKEVSLLPLSTPVVFGHASDFWPRPIIFGRARMISGHAP